MLKKKLLKVAVKFIKDKIIYTVVIVDDAFILVRYNTCGGNRIFTLTEEFLNEIEIIDGARSKHLG